MDRSANLSAAAPCLDRAETGHPEMVGRVAVARAGDWEIHHGGRSAAGADRAPVLPARPRPMAGRHVPDRGDPILFAHRGASAHARANSLAAFRLGLELGATGVETDAWLSTDGIPVLSHESVLRVAGRRIWPRPRTAAQLARQGVPSLLDLYAAIGTRAAVSIDLQHAVVARPVLFVARSAGALDRLHLCSGSFSLLSALRAEAGTARLVHTVRARFVREGLPARVRACADAGIDAVNLAWRTWDAALVASVHHAGLRAYAWDAHTAAAVQRSIDLGVDAVYSDHPEYLAAAARGRRRAIG